jgi:hypothetical protein
MILAKNIREKENCFFFALIILFDPTGLGI